jgi:hypothetical protein
LQTSEACPKSIAEPLCRPEAPPSTSPASPHWGPPPI